ncbi:MAG: methylated-DNA--protein-cysteine methyltransferase [Candidatus Poribacteria bacterium]|nr:MAG: methylated-DNA--protein-cysteine methyltransferase [Candidatus Poribacteria bacterium]
MTEAELLTFRIDTPLGELRIAVGPWGVVAVAFPESDWSGDLRRWAAARSALQSAAPLPEMAVAAEEAFHRYFSGEVWALESVPVDLPVSPATARVLEVVRRIPPGATRSYSAIAQELGYGRLGPRWVGTANARNPAPIVVPCHRVVGKDGALTGYGGGLERKRWLLNWERSHLRPESNG